MKENNFKDPSRIYPLLYQLGDLWIKSPELRLGQLIENIMTSYGRDISSLYYIEDKEFEDKIKEYKKKN